ncbi:MAG TPA: ribonuclease HI [Gemmatimonadales bacterium]|nr:ribonuclease HI [Gemmatimonadales bacterium]
MKAPKAPKAPPLAIYVDGACTGNPGPGGYAALILEGDTEKQRLTGGYQRTTNNRMELMAVIAGLSALKPGSIATVFCDSLYVVKAMNQGWARRWQENDWMRTPRERASNVDLWNLLLALDARHQITYQWVPGHADVIKNNLCDELARRAAEARDLPLDRGYHTEA